MYHHDKNDLSWQFTRDLSFQNFFQGPTMNPDVLFICPQAPSQSRKWSFLQWTDRSGCFPQLHGLGCVTLPHGMNTENVSCHLKDEEDCRQNAQV